jgi:hypothetical protein
MITTDPSRVDPYTYAAYIRTRSLKLRDPAFCHSVQEGTRLPLDSIPIPPLREMSTSTRARNLQALRELVESLEWDYTTPAKQANFRVSLEAGKVHKPRCRDRSNRDLSIVTPVRSWEQVTRVLGLCCCVQPIEGQERQ